MELKKYKAIIEAGPESLDQLERDSILVLIFGMLAEAASIIFPNGKYTPLKWYNLRRWGKLGRLMWDLVVMVYGK